MELNGVEIEDTFAGSISDKDSKSIDHRRHQAMGQWLRHRKQTGFVLQFIMCLLKPVLKKWWMVAKPRTAGLEYHIHMYIWL